MHLVVVGLNHRSAPIEVRERIAISDSAIPAALADLLATDPISEAAVLSTCNRMEVYAVGAPDVAPDRIMAYLADQNGLAPHEFDEFVYVYRDSEAADHLLRVASGLDSLVLGEPQILGQVRDAFEAAIDSKTAGRIIDALFRTAIMTGKRARAQTDIGKGGFSVGHAAVDLARSIFGSLGDATILILGAGKMSELTARHLQSQGIKSILVANRTYERACGVAQRLGGRAIQYDEFPDTLVAADIVISSTAAPTHIVSKELILPAMRRRRGRPLFLIDIAVPRDIDPEVASLDNVFLYDIDDLESVVEHMAKERAGEANRVEEIVAEETGKFMSWWRSLDSVPLVTQLKQKHEAIRRAELARLRNQLPDLPDDVWTRIDTATRSMINRVTRDPVDRLKAATANGVDSPPESILDAARDLFALSDEGTPAAEKGLPE